ncbi:MAG: SRPBCC family protein [Streptosporangiaceae bacterium]|jgi:uncharacterized protein YndB with AHSA1/START domain
MADNMTPEQNAERGYTITRVFDAPRELVWQALTEPARFAQWFGLAGSRLEAVSMDVRPGGRWSATMIIPGAPDMPWEGHYQEATAPERLVMTLLDQQVQDGFFELMTFTLTDLGDKTELMLRQSGGHLPDEEYGRAREGTSAFLDRMAALLAGKG